MTIRVIHTPLLFWASGMALTSRLILIHPSRRGDEALLAHERVHCAQIAAEPFVIWFWAKYLLSPAFRLRVEVEAYRVQIAAKPEAAREVAIETAARLLANNYRLAITLDEARELLTTTTQ